MQALYSLDIHYCFSCKIPKKSGTGYLKSALGYDSINREGTTFNDLCAIVFNSPRDFCELDGYLSIDQPPKLSSKQERDTDAELIINILNQVFPRIKSWKRVSFEVLMSTQ